MGTDVLEKSGRKPLRLPVWLLVTLAITLAVGVLCGLLVNNIFAEQGVSLSTSSLIAFVFTIALGAASIILAGITIVLSRNAEDALIRRSDEGIRIQNEVFVRTNEVLSKIQTSTGLTERRLEDIISGRTGPLVQEIFSKSKLGEVGLPKEIEEKIKKDLADSIKAEILPLVSSGPSEVERRLTAMEKRGEEIASIDESWNTFRSSVVQELQQMAEVELMSETAGDLTAERAEEFWDAVMEINGRIIGLSVHTRAQIWHKGGALLDLV